MSRELSRERSASERRSAARTAVIWDVLNPILGSGALDVLDIGGGTGGFAVRVAELGHRVRVVDPSPDALAALTRRAQEAGVSDRVTGQQGDASNLLEVVDAASADLVLCHGVLEHVTDQAAALAAIGSVLRPGGRLSLLLNQRHAAVIGRAMAGHFQQARALLEPSGQQGEAPTGRGAGRRFTPDEATALVTAAGFAVTAMHGIRVFADLVPGSVLDLEPGAAQALVDLEQAVADLPAFLPLATQVHLLAQR
jgi:SAM-dependent methyltransferase